MKTKLLRNRKVKYIILSIVLISILSLTIAYAVLSTTLNISGTSTVNASDWSFKIEKYDIMKNLNEIVGLVCSLDGYNCQEYYIILNDGQLIQEPTISGTSINNFSISVTKPNDGIEILYSITNTGTIPAKLDAINYKDPQYSSPSNNQNDIEWAQDNILYFDTIDTFNSNDGESELEVGDIICPGETKEIVIVVGITSDTNSLPSDKVTISNLGTEYIFVQADKNSCQ